MEGDEDCYGVDLDTDSRRYRNRAAPSRPSYSSSRSFSSSRSSFRSR
jgi:hypothetical protein